ncbi:glycine cleavage system H protein-like isoform X2 [Branchiostoma lanceolatum]|uniref:glycine cleavage system H protein-like isoform X2 n=1 Tax=Branchiostoma lanceolatum TaxID=7740 RepID=UPI003455D5E9
MAAVAMRCARGLAFRATKLLTSTQTPTYYGAQTFRRFSRTVTALDSVKKFTKDHEWITLDGTTGTIGITYQAQDKLGEIVYVELPEVGAEMSQGDECGAVESVKAVGDLFCPVSGECIEVNTALEEDASLINSSPYEDGWILKMKLSKPEELDDLMDEEAYQAFVKTEDS